MSEVIEKLGEIGIIPVVAIDDAETAVPLGQALLEGGLPCAEITFRTAAAADAIQNMSAAFPDILVGAGTVLTVAQAEQAAVAGQAVADPGRQLRSFGYAPHHLLDERKLLEGLSAQKGDLQIAAIKAV